MLHRDPDPGTAMEIVAKVPWHEWGEVGQSGDLFTCKSQELIAHMYYICVDKRYTDVHLTSDVVF